MPITRNLYAALRRLRYRCLDRFLWVDSICINQEDIEERGRQVRLMAEIYAYANRVVVWLEEVISADGDVAVTITTNSGPALGELGAAAAEGWRAGSAPAVEKVGQ